MSLRPGPVAVLLALALLAPATVAHAQEATPAVSPTPTPPAQASPSASDIAGQVLGGLAGQLAGGVSQGLTAWIDGQGVGALLRLLTAWWGAAFAAMVALFGGVLSRLNFVTQLPPGLTYELAPVQAVQARLRPVAAAVLGAALVWGVALTAYDVHTGRPFGHLLRAVPAYLAGTAGLLWLAQPMRWWQAFSNALSGALLDPLAGLPGLDRVAGVEQLSALGVAGMVYLVCGFLLLLHRVVLLVLVCLLWATYPLACALHAVPVGLAQRAARWWGHTFVVTVFVQVPVAAVLAIGAALIAAPWTGPPGQASLAGGPHEEAAGVVLGIGSLVAAWKVPGLLLGGLARVGGTGGVSAAALHVLSAVASGLVAGGVAAGAAGAARVRPFVGTLPGTGTATGGQATVSQVAGTGGARVRSLLAERPPALPAPKD